MVEATIIGREFLGAVSVLDTRLSDGTAGSVRYSGTDDFAVGERLTLTHCGGDT